MTIRDKLAEPCLAYCTGFRDAPSRHSTVDMRQTTKPVKMGALLQHVHVVSCTCPSSGCRRGESTDLCGDQAVLLEQSLTWDITRR